MKNIVIASILLLFLFPSCDSSYDIGEIDPLDDARMIYVNVDDRYIGWEHQRSFYDHEANTVTVEYLENTIRSGKSLDALIVYTAPVFGATFTPLGGQEEDWTSPRTYTVTSGDGSASRTYTVELVEVTAF